MFQNHLARVKSWVCIELFKFGVLLSKVSLSYLYSNKVSPVYLWFVSLFLSLLDSLCSNSYATPHSLFCFSNLSLYFTLHPWCSQSQRGKLQEAHINKPSFVKFSFSRVDLMTPPQNICLYYGNIWIAGEPRISLSDVLPTVLTHQEPKMIEKSQAHNLEGWCCVSWTRDWGILSEEFHKRLLFSEDVAMSTKSAWKTAWRYFIGHYRVFLIF